MRTFGTITAKSGERLRKGPSVETLALDLMPYGDRVEILQDRNDNWYFVKWCPRDKAPENSLQGFASKTYVHKDDPASQAPASPSPEPPPVITQDSDNGISWGWVIAAVVALGLFAWIWNL